MRSLESCDTAQLITLASKKTSSIDKRIVLFIEGN